MSHIIRSVSYAGWKDCIQISNSVFEAIITTDVGPRIIRYSQVNGPNMLWINEYTAGQTEETKTWRAYGGHSFDAVIDGTEFLPPENTPVKYQLTADSIVFDAIRQGPIIKDISIRMCRRGGLEICQKITNLSQNVISASVNGNTLLKNSGTAVLPITSEMQDFSGCCSPYLFRGNKSSLIRHDMTMLNEDTVSIRPSALWCGYFSQGNLFIMTSPFIDGTFPRNSSLSFSSDASKYRMSTYSPESVLNPGESVEHTEVWNIFTGFPQPKDSEEAEKMLSGKRYYYDFIKMPVKGLDF